MNSIPASQLVQVTPSVLGAGGNALSLNAVFLTTNGAVPIGAVIPFSTLADVGTFFGLSSDEYRRAAIYFSGFTGADTVPGTLYFAQYNSTAVAAYVRGAQVSGLTLAQLQALSGTLSIVINGDTITSAAINLAGATSFSNAAALIQAGIDTTGGIFSGTGSQAAGVVTISATTTGHLSVGDVLGGAGVTAGSVITSFGTYTVLSGVGTVNVSTSATVGSGAVTVSSTATVAYDSQRGAFVITSPTTGAASTIGYAAVGALATGLKLTQAAGAVLSQGAAVAVPAALMAAITAATQNFISFMTVAEVSLTVKQQFAAWVQTAGERFMYVAQDSDVLALQASQAGTFGAIVAAANDDGVVAVYDTSGGDLAAFVCGVTASIDFSQTDGSLSYAYRQQAGLAPQITDATVANNLIGNGYNFYGAYATANQAFTFFQPGQMAGQWKWINPYVNQVYLNSQLQLSLVELMANVKSLPYNVIGYGMIRVACLDPINEALNNGSIRTGVQLSATQVLEINTAAQAKVDNVLTNQGWYLQVKPASPQVRAARGSPPITLWYTDGGSIQKINLASIDVQ